MNLTQAIKIHSRLAAIADDLQIQVCRLRHMPPLGPRGMPGFDTVSQVTDACIELDRQITNLRETVARLEQEQAAPELYRLVDKYDLNREELGLNVPA